MERIKKKETGVRYEEKVFGILLNSICKLPFWIKGFYITRQNNKLDRNGVDIVVETTDIGDLYVQVKGRNRSTHSKGGGKGKKVKRGRQYYASKNIGYVCVRNSDNKVRTDEKILEIFLDEVMKLRERK